MSFKKRKRDYKGKHERELGRNLEMKRTHESERHQEAANRQEKSLERRSLKMIDTEKI